jgi:hypothetical protein
MFDQKIALEGEDGGLTLPYSKTIFVMEDVDAASTVVQRRWVTAKHGWTRWLMMFSCRSPMACFSHHHDQPNCLHQQESLTDKSALSPASTMLPFVPFSQHPHIKLPAYIFHAITPLMLLPTLSVLPSAGPLP